MDQLLYDNGLRHETVKDGLHATVSVVFVLEVAFLTSKLKLHTFSVTQLADTFKIQNVTTVKVESFMFYVFTIVL